MKHYIKLRIWDWLLCILCQIGLVFNLFACFVLDDPLCGSTLLVIAVTAVLDVIFFVFAYNRALTVTGLLLGALALGAYIYYAASSDVFADEAAHSLGISFAITVFSALAVFLLSRTRAGLIVMFIIGNFINAGAYFLRYPVRLWTYLVFVFAAFLFYLYRNYRVTISRVHSGSVKLAGFILQAFIVCLLAFSLGAGAYQGIIKPLDPPTRELKLISQLRRMDLFKVLGITTMREMFDPDLLTKEELQDLIYTNELNEEGEVEKEAEEDPSQQQEAEDIPGEIIENVGSYLTRLVYMLFHEYLWVWIAVLAAAAVCAAFVIRYLRRRSWRMRVEALSPENQVVNYYRYFLSRFGRLGYKKPAHYTLYEYSDSIEHEASAFSSGDITAAEG